MSKADCKCKEVECEECPEWIFTLADLIMCMMGLFVILWVLKPSPTPQKPEDNEEWIKVAASIREAFGYLPDPKSKDPVDLHLLMKKLEQLDPHKGPGKGGDTTLARKSPRGVELESSTIRHGKQSIVGGRLLFAAGEAAPSAGLLRTLDEVADLIRGHRNIVLIRGHTSLDDLPEGATAQQRMDLSIRRAQAVADYLTSRQVEPEILRVQGCSTFEPVRRGAYTPDGQAVNRRVEIEASATLADERQDVQKAPPAAKPAGQDAARPKPAPSPSADAH